MKPVVSYAVIERSDSWIRVKVELSHPFRGFTHQVLSLPLPEFAEDAAIRRRVCDKLKMETGLLVYAPDELQEIKPAEPADATPAYFGGVGPHPTVDPNQMARTQAAKRAVMSAIGQTEEPKKKRKGGR